MEARGELVGRWLSSEVLLEREVGGQVGLWARAIDLCKGYGEGRVVSNGKWKFSMMEEGRFK